MNTTIRHRMEWHEVNSNTEILIVGTFNPETQGNSADFFYGRERNFLWRLLPASFQHQDLKGADRQCKQEFIAATKVDFVDLITAVEVEKGKEADYSDAYIDQHVAEWTDVIGLIKSLKNLKKVVVTRKTFSDVPNIKKCVDTIEEYCSSHSIAFECLPTPARFYNQSKQETWTKAFSS
jgi:G:T/U-mismatch repair DNA glycosylase